VNGSHKYNIYLINSVGRRAITTTCFGPQFAVVRLSTQKRILNTICKLSTFYYQLTHTTLKNVELIKHPKINKNVPTCFGLLGNHLQGAKVSTWLKVTRLVKSRCVKDVQGFVSAMAAYCDLYGVCVVHCVRVY